MVAAQWGCRATAHTVGLQSTACHTDFVATEEVRPSLMLVKADLPTLSNQQHLQAIVRNFHNCKCMWAMPTADA